MMKFHPAPIPDVFVEITEDDVLTDWELDFLASVEAQDYPLTDTQQAKFDEIQEEVPKRIRWAQRGEWPVNRRR